MSTKEQERKALEQIKEIVAGLGEGSYIAAAFEGGFELAAENIENDFACSLRDRWEGRAKDAEQTLEDCKRVNASLRETIHNLQAGEQGRSALKDHTIAEQAAYIDELERREQDLRAQLAEREKDYEAAHAAAHDVAGEKDAEILKLKAKLYDALLGD